MIGSLLNKKASIIMLAFFISVFISQNSYAKPLLAIIIDDIGDQYESGKQAIELDGQFTYALLPFTRYAKKLSRLGLKSNKEFILHSPMQSVDSRLHYEHSLHMHMSKKQFIQALNEQLQQFPFIHGINNHMGSLLTRHAGYMDLLMKQIRQHKNFYFIDSRTTAQTVAFTLAKKNRVPALKRDIFLDTDKSTTSIKAQLNTAVKLANHNGYAVAIAHPYRETLSVLQNKLNDLKKHVELVSVSTLLSTLAETTNEKSTRTLSSGL